MNSGKFFRQDNTHKSCFRLSFFNKEKNRIGFFSTYFFVWNSAFFAKNSDLCDFWFLLCRFRFVFRDSNAAAVFFCSFWFWFPFFRNCFRWYWFLTISIFFFHTSTLCKNSTHFFNIFLSLTQLVFFNSLWIQYERQTGWIFFEPSETPNTESWN